MKYLLGSIRVVLILINTAFQISRLVVDEWINGRTVDRSFKHRRRWARSCCWLLGIRVDEVTGSPDVPYGLVISNHRTLLDPVIQAAYLDAYIIAKAEVGNLPIISLGAKKTGIIFVKRDKLRSRIAARDKTQEVLLSGSSVLVYAEGTTGTNQTTDKFKVGTFGIAAEHDLPVIPVAIDYPQQKDYWFKTSMSKQIFGQIGAWSTHVKLRILPSIKGSEAKSLMKEVRTSIDKNLLEMQEGWTQIF